ncbi:MAG: hypothetical protein A3D24_01180 [Candidatus Blackburnbacteria bacterium RIFCSPHIGHO2_02_FULL_39_13]|uniref:PDZ domain-containing protein n=1 Tax=Candidatus Blackburnbacteria bacterium RIFCSPLOWO2_01_FULL_40_20 TaxID=1797519 RepID=A0A1G1VFK7_9BACT|nr:MAG: 2-alkenal reductase [Microgenomates group bacterium GW2011_GWA2_39_19]OGY07312.1 MAG: hypothetical protein A2694_04360 [Candidatus Blackburnbacteria bacterium RIFCSPHIGHO2_01_FULL_40_17]OGY08072.1 MAG: hypothetical protein A3D24_01180 [Candidatus Blackburnbacteria bacterium RIFCSPHIGHO2_02_FULL_39_13]OGY14161.1 MAG: hypothetical protein A3A77_04860 [Candidatus Blackburnbacteria bacterium RIFCSPLOWO2_01_FULL_40_20]OGY15457.1 MAG: hypothetical protein A3I52_01985 [Candidatus Blackburnbact
MRRFIITTVLGIVILVSVLGGALADRIFVIKPLDYIFPRISGSSQSSGIGQKQVVNEESVVINTVKESSPAVVTIAIQTPRRRILDFNPFSGFGIKEQGGGQQDLATGFIVSADGLIVTNKHVVDAQGSYKAITKEGKEYEIKKIYRDPANDIALLKIDATGLPEVKLGDSENLQVGQLVIAIGTPLGEFRQSVTTGVISGLGRGIEAGGNPYEGYVERLDNVIQTDAAINPGNSGGPLLNSSGQVIGVNVAVAAGAQNIGFAIPINVVKGSIEQFHNTGEFVRPFFGVQYQIVSKAAALANEVPQGAYVQDVVSGSSADKAGIKPEDIIIKFGGEKIEEDKGGLAVLVNKHKVGEKVDIEVWRDDKTIAVSATLEEAKE